MKPSILLLLFCCLTIFSCNKKEEVEPLLEVKILGQWKSGDYKWQYFDENGNELMGEDKYPSPHLIYTIDPKYLQTNCDPCQDGRERFIFRPYSLFNEGGIDYITTYDGFIRSDDSESTFRIASITASKMVWIIEYSDLEFVSVPSSETQTAAKATATLELTKVK